MTSSTPLQVPFTEIKSVTNNFSDASVIGEGFFGKIYEGQLSLSGEVIDVAVRRSDHSFWLQDFAFDKEYTMLSNLKHKNLVSIVGFCNENDEIIIINKRDARGSLNRHLSGTTLNWKKRLEISVGVASALSYLHNDGARGYSVIHHNVTSASILLDEKWEAKLSGFEYSMRIPAGDLDLAYEKLGIGTYKSDVFSFGIVLFEILCGTKAFISTENNKFEAQSAIFHFEGGKLHELVDPDLFKQMDPQSFHIFSETAYKCLKKQAPLNMIQVLTRLKRALKLQAKHENKEEHSTVVRKGPLSKNMKLKLKHLEHMRIQLKDILSATESFASKYCIVSGGFGMVYYAVLDHVDREYCYAIEGKNEQEVPKRRSKVAVKRIFDTEDDSGEQGFYTEIEILTSCKHSNILTLLGFCDEGSAMILVYEYASNGSLADCLQNKRNMTNDSWAQRIKICLQVAKGLNYLHTSERDRHEIVHRDIKSANILLDENLDAKIGDFGLCKFLSVNEDHKTEYSREIAGTEVYMDPQYAREGKLKKELDIYSLGVVMFEILCGKVAFDQIYTSHNNQGLALKARWHFEKGTVKEIVDPRIKEGITEPNLPFYKRRDQNSVDTFTKIAYKCLAVTQENRPSMENVIKELEEALLFQKNQKANLQISLEDIIIATQNFNDKNIIREDGHYKMYKGEISHANGHSIIDVKRLNPSSEYKANGFSAELKVLMEHKHENLIGFVGYCDELDEKIIVYEHGSLVSLDMYLHDVSLTWRKRLKICIDIASGLDFLHGGATTREVVIHRNIRSRNIQLDGDLKAKIVDFEFSITRSQNQEMVFYTNFIKGTDGYIDPQYKNNGLLSKECDIYSMGVVLFEIMSGKVVYSEEILKYDVDLGPLVRLWHEEEQLDEMVFKKTNEQIAPESLAAFQRIVIQCLHDKREERPTAGEVVMQLKKAQEIQEKGMEIVRFSFEDIKLATDNFSDEKCLGSGGSGKVYIGQLPHGNGQKIIAAKQMDGAHEFYKELEILAEFRHKNVMGLEGCCDEMGKRIIIYEYQSMGSLDRWLNNISFSWVKRLSVCIDIASGLDFLHGGVRKQEAVIHKDIRSSNILLSGGWKAKIAQFGHSSVSPVNQLLESDNSVGALGYRDPQYASMGFLTKESDIYSLGVVLFEILCGRLTMEYSYDNNLGLVPLVRSHYDEGKLDEMVFEGIRKQISPESLITFAKVAYQCLHDNREERPTAYEVMIQLEQALESQEDCEKWEPKLPSDYKDIINMSKTPEIYYNMKKKDLFYIFSRGIYIQEDKVRVRLDNYGRRTKVMSPTLFSYENKGSLRWRHRQQSIFKKTSMMLDASNLQIRIQINAHLLSPGVMYAVMLVFKFGDKKKTQNGRMYVNLKYKKGNETLHAYFAQLNDDGWMFVNLYEFLNEKEDDEFEVLLESFSRYYCGSGAIYFSSLQLVTFENVEAEEIEELKEDQQVSRPNPSMGQLQELSTNNEDIFGISKTNDEGEKLFELSEVNGKMHYMLCAKEVVYDSSNRKLYDLKPSEQSRFQKVIELLPQQVSGIKYKIEKQKLSPNTIYACYLVFKLSDKCRGLQCPVKIRNILDKNGRLDEHCYFRSPAPWNSHSTKRPKQREDGWMEVSLRLINTNEDLINEHFPLNLKLICFEGTMSGLIVEGLEFRPWEN